jgi:hypothetical protein
MRCVTCVPLLYLLVKGGGPLAVEDLILDDAGLRPNPIRISWEWDRFTDMMQSTEPSHESL